MWVRGNSRTSSKYVSGITLVMVFMAIAYFHGSRRRHRKQFLVFRVVHRIVVARRHYEQVVVHLVPRENLAELGDEQTGLHVPGQLLEIADIVLRHMTHQVA